MRKTLPLALALLMFATVNAQKNVVKVNPLGLIFGSLNASYERALSDKSAIEFSLDYTTVNVTVDSGENAKATGLGLGAGYKIYFSKNNVAPRGWYAEPNLNYASVSASSGNEEGKVNAFSVGALGGYQWVFGGSDSGFALDLGLGFQYFSASTTGNVNDTGLSGFIPAAKLAIGYGF